MTCGRTLCTFAGTGIAVVPCCATKNDNGEEYVFARGRAADSVMPRRRGRPTTVAQAAKPSAAACDVCGQTIKAGEPVAWTWARRRIHEPCMPAWLVSSRRPFGPWVAQAVRLSLDANGGQLCTACLALGFSLNLEESRELATICAGLPGFRVLPVSCDTCRRVGDVLCIVPDRTSCDPDDATSQAAR